MDSVASRAAEDAKKQEEIKRQIALLQAQLEDLPDCPQTPPRKKQKSGEPSIIAPATPSPRKKRLAEERTKRQLCPPPSKPQPARPQQPSRTSLVPQFHVAKSTASSSSSTSVSKASFISQLRSLNPSKTEATEPSVQRTEGFSEKPVASQVKTPVRDETLAIVEDLEPGPSYHKPPTEDPSFDKLEPNSGIRLNSRKLSHNDVQDHLSGRYFLPPSLLYSVVRLQPNKQGYDVPVEGDWVTIAVVAERGDVRFTSGAGNASKEKEDDSPEASMGAGHQLKGSGRSGAKRNKKEGVDEDEDEEEQTARRGGKKFVHLRLVDLGHRSRSAPSSTSRGTLRGDAQLSLLLFESDYFDKLISKDDKGKEKIQKIWRGGSGGAFEECLSKLYPGTVIAILNAKVLKPYQNAKNPSSSSILALTPPTASAIAVIGTARDLGRCKVRRRDGKPCGAWVDKRISSATPGSSKSSGEDVCEYHVQTTVQRTRAGRAEFSIGTTGLSTTAKKRNVAEYDPARQWGLKPETSSRGIDGENMYVLGGFVASSSTRPQAPGVTGETMGREAQARAKRRLDKSNDKALQELLERNKNGCSVVAEGSREALEIVRRAKEAVIKSKEKEARRKSTGAKYKDEDSGQAEESDHSHQPAKKSFSAEMIKRLGFDPTLKPYGQKGDKKGPPNALLGGQKRDFNLGPPPGKKVRSGVSAPVSSKPEDDSESDLEIEE